MNKEEIDEIDELEIDFNNIDELNLALEVSSKKAIYLLDEFSNEIINLQQENKQLKEQVDRLIKKEYERDNNYIVKARTGEQLERGQYLLCFKSKITLASMLIDAEDKIDKAIEYINDNNLYEFESDEEEIFEYVTDKKSKYDLFKILGENNG